jgi:phage-related protein (TIGR01555 family)
MYKTHGIIQTAIDVPVMDAMRGGLDLHSEELDAHDLGDMMDFIEENDIIQNITEAKIWSRLYGGGALILDDGTDPESEFNPERVKQLKLYPANRWELMTKWNPNDPMMSSGEIKPWMYSAARQDDYFVFYGIRIHRSRVLTFTGKCAPYVVKWQLQGWGMSELERMVEDFNKYLKTNNVLYEILEEAKIDVYMLSGLRDQLVSDVGTANTTARIQLMNQTKNFQKAIILDKEDVFDQKQLTFAGLAEVMKENRIGIASALRMPLSKIFGLSATGFNSGEDDIENYNAMVESEIRMPLKKPIRMILNLIARLKYGYDVDIDFSFKPLRVIGAVEEEVIRTSKQNRYQALYDRGLMDSKEMGEVMHKENLVPIETCAAKGLLDEHPNPMAGNDGLDEGGEEKEGKDDKGKGDE